MITEEVARARVRRGMTRMVKANPERFLALDVTGLDQGNPEGCMLARWSGSALTDEQLEELYREEFGRAYWEAVAEGFFSGAADGPGDSLAVYALLTRVWVEEMATGRERLAQKLGVSC